jgi:3,4-dihydroxy 2-butanone 4-phosphate synthase/GTP cyclohydrolase II
MISVEHDISVDDGKIPVHVHSVFGPDPKSYLGVAAIYREVKDDCLVRIHSKCMYSEVFASIECDCGWQLKRSRELLTREGGVLIYLDQEGRGAGLRAKAAAYQLNHADGLDTYQAYEQLGLPSDSRDYADAAQILNELGLASVRLLTNNPSKIEALQKAGIRVVREPLKAEATAATIAYLRAKKRHGHLL